VVVICLTLFEGFLGEELDGVFHVVSVVNGGIVDVVPVPTLVVESVDFVTDSRSFEIAFVHVVRTPCLDGESKGECLG
jgi:hypothetical protein